MLFAGLGRSVLGKTVPEVLSLVNFVLQQFHTVRVRLTFRSSKPVLITEVFKSRDSVFADFKTEQ